MRLIHYMGFVIVSLLFLSEVLLATQLYPQFSPNIVSSNKIFNDDRDANNLIPNARVNIRNSSYEVEDGFLALSAQRQRNIGVTIFDVKYDLDVPLKADMTLNYSIFASDFDLNVGSVYVYLTLANTTHFLVLGYQVGQVEQDRIPEITAPSNLYVFYQVGNSVAKNWFGGERNIFQDIVDKGIDISVENWRVEKMVFGFWSQPAEPASSASSYSCIFDLSKTSLYYENTTSTKILSTSPLFSQTVAAAMIIVAFLMLLTIMIIFKKGKNPTSFNTVATIGMEKLSLKVICDLE